MPVTPTATVSIEWNFDNAASDQTVTVLAFSKLGSTEPFGPVDLGVLINETAQAWSDTIGLIVTQDLNVVTCRARDYTTGGGAAVELEPAEGGFLNTDTGTSMPPWECVVVSHGTTQPGRSGRGRTFLPGCRASFVDSSGTVDAVFRQQMASAWSQFRDAIQDAGQTQPVAQVVYSRLNDDVSTVIGSQVRPIVGIQRDRRFGSP